jgi:hypothetical protein
VQEFSTRAQKICTHAQKFAPGRKNSIAVSKKSVEQCFFFVGLFIIMKGHNSFLLARTGMDPNHSAQDFTDINGMMFPQGSWDNIDFMCVKIPP